MREGLDRVSANNQKKSYQAHEIQFGQGPYNNPLGQEWKQKQKVLSSWEH